MILSYFADYFNGIDKSLLKNSYAKRLIKKLGIKNHLRHQENIFEQHQENKFEYFVAKFQQELYNN